MKNSSFFSFLNSFLIIFIFIFLISIIFIPILSINTGNNNNFIYNLDSDHTYDFIWPLQDYTHISSHFGKRNAPTSGASTFHKGTDIPAPPGTPLIAVADGTITFTNFLGGGGYTITLSVSDSIKITYCHVSPNFIVSKGDIVKQGDIIGHVGPKNVYGVLGNKYKDSNGNPTNGSTTGPHLHIGFRINGEYVNPLDYLRN